MADWLGPFAPLVAPLVSALAAAGGAWLTYKVQSRQAGAQEAQSLGVLIDARTREWTQMLADKTSDIARLSAENAQLRAEHAQMRLKHEEDMAEVRAQNDECQRLTRALIVRIEELLPHG